MKYRTLGRTGLKVSVVGLGTWQLGGEWGKTFGQSEVDAILDRAAESGINLIDTAECYGDHLAERLIGDYLSRHDRDRWIVATKFGHALQRLHGQDRPLRRGGGQGPAHRLAPGPADRQDRRLPVPLGIGRGLPRRRPRRALEDARRSGMVRNLGVSIRGAGSEIQAREAFGRGYGVLQVVYNRLDLRAESEIFPHARR